ncbi:MAG: hypothetical protein OHK0029_41660 [Armatimonadaceae bacterium]
MQASEQAGHLSPVGVATVTTKQGVSGDGFAVSVTVGAEHAGEGVLFTFTNALRDWSAGKSLVLILQANGAHRLKFHFKHGNGGWTFYLVPRPGITSRVVIPFDELTERPPNTGYSGFSRFGGGPQPIDLSNVESLSITFNQVAPEEKRLTISKMYLADEVPESVVLNPEPVVDSWGQWTGERGKPRTEEEIRAFWQAEPATFTGFDGQTETTGAESDNRIGEGTGFFRVEQVNDRWFLVDPDGFAFWSVGCDCVRAKSEGPIHNERLYSDLSPVERSEARRGRWSYPLWADFYRANLKRRYEHGSEGEGWYDVWAEQTVTRLRKWGFNTIANWSDPELTARGQMPYTTNVSSLGPLCGHLPDVYAPDFADRVRESRKCCPIVTTEC